MSIIIASFSYLNQFNTEHPYWEHTRDVLCVVCPSFMVAYLFFKHCSFCAWRTCSLGSFQFIFSWYSHSLSRALGLMTNLWFMSWRQSFGLRLAFLLHRFDSVWKDTVVFSELARAPDPADKWNKTHLVWNEGCYDATLHCVTQDYKWLLMDPQM